MMPSYRGTLAVARPSDRKQRIATLRAIADSPPAIQLYFDVVAGIRPFAELQEAIGRVKRYAS
jgi:hypothetical protein